MPVVVLGEAKGGDDYYSRECGRGRRGKRRSGGALKSLSSSVINTRDCSAPSPFTPKTLGMKRTLNGSRVTNAENQNKDHIEMAKRQTVLKQAALSRRLRLRNQNAYNIDGRIPVKRLKGDKTCSQNQTRCDMYTLQGSFGCSFCAYI